MVSLVFIVESERSPVLAASPPLERLLDEVAALLSVVLGVPIDGLFDVLGDVIVVEPLGDVLVVRSLGLVVVDDGGGRLLCVVVVELELSVVDCA